VIRFLTLDAIKKEYPRLARSVGELSDGLRNGKNPLDPSQSALDYLTPLTKGCDWLFEHLSQYQTKAYAAIADQKPSLLVGERIWTDSRIGKKRWTSAAFVKLGDRYIVLHPEFVGRIEDSGVRHPCYARYSALPEGIAKAYYARMDGMEIVHQLPHDPMTSRVLPTKISGWQRAKHLCKGRKTRDDMVSALKTVADPQVTESIVESFWVLLDTREQDSTAMKGDYLLVQEGSQSKHVFHVRDWDFSGVRKVEEPELLMDEYVAHLFGDASNDFDFSAFGRSVG